MTKEEFDTLKSGDAVYAIPGFKNIRPVGHDPGFNHYMTEICAEGIPIIVDSKGMDADRKGYRVFSEWTWPIEWIQMTNPHAVEPAGFDELF